MDIYVRYNNEQGSAERFVFNNKNIPADASNRSYQELLAKVAEGTAEVITQLPEPTFDPLSQELVPTDFEEEGQRFYGYNVVSLPQEQVALNKAAAASEVDPTAVSAANSLLLATLVDPDTLSDEVLLQVTGAYPAWSPNGTYVLNDVRLYDNKLWRCVQPHTAQPTWAPEFVPALWTPYRQPGAAPAPWVQPTGAQDAYAIGERVVHDNPNEEGALWVYESSIAANTTEPGRDGTFDRYWTPIEAA